MKSLRAGGYKHGDLNQWAAEADWICINEHGSKPLYLETGLLIGSCIWWCCTMGLESSTHAFESQWV